MKTAIKISAALLVAVLLLHSTGCTSINKSINKVLANPAAENQVGNNWALMHPCVTDTLMSRSKADTTISFEPLSFNPFDVTKLNVWQDSDDIFTAPVQIVSGNAVIVKTHPVGILKKTTITIRDTAYVKDMRALKIALDSVSYYKALNGEKDAKISSLTASSRDFLTCLAWTLKALTRQWWFWTLLACTGLYRWRKPLLILITGLI